MKEQPLHVQYYDAIYKYFTTIVKTVNKDDFETVKKTVGDEEIEETYELHIEALMNSLKPKEETTIHIAEFLKQYPEFTDKYYLRMVKRVIESVETSSDKIKKEVYNKLLQYGDEVKDGRRANNGPYDSDDSEGEESQYEDDEIHVRIRNADVILKTYHDPLLIHLYNILFTTFSARYAHV